MSSSKALWLLLAMLTALASVGCVEKRLGPVGSSAATGLGAPPLAAAATPVPSPTPYFPQNRPLDERAPVKLRADHLRYDARSKETRFSGNVVARQDSTVLKSDELVSGDQGQSARAKGHLRLRDDERRLEIRASEGEYRDALGTAELRGGVVLHSQDPYALPVTVTGKTAWYQSVSRLARVSGGVKVK
ncbi:MAG: LptA/OstA family protein, partial [candidate division FCPU426 bacterium]